MKTVAALYIDPKGPYPRMDGVDCWDELRDARKYPGPYPVVAHPPCGPWGRLRFLCGPRLIEQQQLGIIAVEAVQQWGGVLENPVDSALWNFCRLPRPNCLPDEFGGWSLFVRQVSWGHCCVKPTWIYIVGADPDVVLRGIRHGGTPTHQIGIGGRRLLFASSEKRRRTPPEFAEYLASIARSV